MKNKPVTIFGKGTQTRSFCYVSDLIEGIYRLMMSDYDLPVNIGNPVEMTMLQFAQQIIDATKSEEQNRLQAPAAGRPEAAQARHHQGEENPRLVASFRFPRG